MVEDDDALSLIVRRVLTARLVGVKHMVADYDALIVSPGLIPGLEKPIMMATAQRVSSKSSLQMTEAKLSIRTQRKSVSAMPSIRNLKDSFMINHFIQVNVIVL